VEFKDQQRMVRQGSTLYDSKEQPLPAETSRMVQGGIESSNVSPVSEMVKVMEISRSVGSTAKFVETMYDLQRKTASTYTRSQSA
jgi:flagellar basal-body rod protein FlgF